MDSFEKKSYESAVELEPSLDENSFLFSEEISESNKFIKFSNNLVDIGFIYYDVGLDPQIESLTLSNNIFVGINSIYACLDSTPKTVLFEEKLPSLLYEILIDSDSKYIVFVCELDVFVYENSGSLLCSMGFKNVIEDYYLEGTEFIVIECDDGDKTTFSLESGRVE